MATEGSNFEEIAAIAQARRAAALPVELHLKEGAIIDLPKDLSNVFQTSGHFSSHELDILESDAERILRQVKEKQWSAVEVAQAFCRGAAVAQQLTNCLTEILFSEAVTRAKELDEHLERTGSVIGPLHGLPISLKDCFNVPPHPSSIGMSHWANVPTTPAEESSIVTVLRNLGAVLYVKTNVPVAMMMMETSNYVWGETINPLHTGCSAGGSSGGEAALLAMCGALGVGTDIGGSIRIPSAFCGLYGLKPSAGRFPHWSSRSGIPGQEFIASINGPMSRSLTSLKLYCAAVLSPSAAPWALDPKCIPLSWNPHPQIAPPGRSLRLAILPPHDTNVTAHPPVQHALSYTRAALIAAGHQVIDWSPLPHFPELQKLLLAAFFAFGGSAIVDLLTPHKEPLRPSMASYGRAAETEANMKAQSNGLGATLDAKKLREMNLQRVALCKAYLRDWYATAIPSEGLEAIDGLIAPVSPWAACRRGSTEYDTTDEDRAGPGPYFAYTGVFNVLDLPACTFPVFRVGDQEEIGEIGERGEDEFEPLSNHDEKIRKDWDRAFYEGAPVGLQLVGERLREEKVLEVTGLVKRALEEWKSMGRKVVKGT